VLNATGTTQVLKSPSYPSNYPSNLRCRWTLDGARFNDEVDVRFLDLDIEPSSDCSKDRLQIRDISSSVRTVPHFIAPIGSTGSSRQTGRRKVCRLPAVKVYSDENTPVLIKLQGIQSLFPRFCVFRYFCIGNEVGGSRFSFQKNPI